jgi:hypothetical protein
VPLGARLGRRGGWYPERYMICVKARRREKFRTQFRLRCERRAARGGSRTTLERAKARVSLPPIAAAGRHGSIAKHDVDPIALAMQFQTRNCDELHISYRGDRAGQIGSGRFHGCFNHWTTNNCTWRLFNDILTTGKCSTLWRPSASPPPVPP